MDAYIVSEAKKGLLLVLILSGPPISAALIVGLFVSIIQATTQVQEQTLTFVPKLVSIVMVLLFMGPQGVIKISEYAQHLLSTFYQHVP